MRTDGSIQSLLIRIKHWFHSQEQLKHFGWFRYKPFAVVSWILQGPPKIKNICKLQWIPQSWCTIRNKAPTQILAATWQCHAMTKKNVMHMKLLFWKLYSAWTEHPEPKGMAMFGKSSHLQSKLGIYSQTDTCMDSPSSEPFLPNHWILSICIY